MVYAMIYIGIYLGAFCIRFASPGTATTMEGAVVGDLIAAFGWGTVGSAAALVFLHAHGAAGFP